MSKDGGPAFPYTNCEDHGICGAYGMTLRDYFAAKAMQGILAGKASNFDFWDSETPEMTARQAYERADAMLAERNK